MRGWLEAENNTQPHELNDQEDRPSSNHLLTTFNRFNENSQNHLFMEEVIPSRSVCNE